MAYANASIKNQSWTGTTASYLLTETVAVNDLLFIQWTLSNAGAGLSPTISDTVNTGNYTVIGTPLFVSGQNNSWGLSAISCNATGTPTLNLTSPYSNGHWCITHWTGFTNTATLDTGLGTPFSSGTGTAISGSGTTAQSTELCLGVAFGGGSYTQPGSPWNNPFNGGGGPILQIVWQSVASPSAISYAGTLGVSENWALWLPGFYSASGGGGGSVITQPTMTTVGCQ